MRDGRRLRSGRVGRLRLPVLLSLSFAVAPGGVQGSADTTAVFIADTVSVSYELPAGYTILDSLEACPSYLPVRQENGVIDLVALDLDTLALPPLRACSTAGRDTILLPPPLVVVGRTRPDTLFEARPFEGPVAVDIPVGLPEDYLRPLLFWREWSSAPSGRLLLPLLLAVPLAAAVTAVLLIRRKRRPDAAGSGEVQVDARAPGALALELLESEWMARGDWPSLYAAVDRLYRRLLSARFGLSNEALTHRQIGSRLAETEEGRRFSAESAGLLEQVRLQRYAAWGTSRGRAAADIRSLAALLDEWWPS